MATMSVPPKGLKSASPYEVARSNLLLVVAFTTLNIILGVMKANMYLLFSAIVPYYLVVGFPYLIFDTPDTRVLLICAGIAIAIILLYLLCWIFSKKHRWLLILALVFFLVDTAFLFLWFKLSADLILDYLFHAWVLFSLIRGIVNAYKKKEEDLDALGELRQEGVISDESQEIPADTPLLRYAENVEKERKFAEADYEGMHIVYRRYGKRTEELVVDGKVYAEMEANSLTPSHSFDAVVKGHKICVGYYGANNFIIVDDTEQIAKSVRW